MAPETETLKRRRSRPSEWWTVNQNDSHVVPQTSQLKINSATLEKNKELPNEASQSDFAASGNNESILMTNKFPASKLGTTSVRSSINASNKTIQKEVKRKTVSKALKRETHATLGNVAAYDEPESSLIASNRLSRRTNGKENILTIKNNKDYDELQAVDNRSTEKQVSIDPKKGSKLRDKKISSLDKLDSRTGIIKLRNNENSELTSSLASSVAERIVSNLNASHEHVNSIRKLRRAKQDVIGTKKSDEGLVSTSVTRDNDFIASRPGKPQKKLVAHTAIKKKFRSPLRPSTKEIEMINSRKRPRNVNDETIKRKKRKKENKIQLLPESPDDNGESKGKNYPRTSVRSVAENVASNTNKRYPRKIKMPVMQNGLPNSLKTSILRSSKDPSYHHNTSNNESDDDEPLTYQKLTAVTRYVPQYIIEKKWRALPSNYIEPISNLLQDIEKDIIFQLGSKRRIEVGTVLQQISRKLITKLSNGALFPISRRKNQENFNFEKILDKNKLLENHLTPILHTNELLKTELNKELAWLEVEEEKLGELETNAKTERASRNEANRKLHAVLQRTLSKVSLDVEDQVGLEFQKEPSPNLSNFKVPCDDDLISLVKDIYGHVESLQRNAKQVNGISEVIAQCKATLQATLFDQLDHEEFESIIMGI